MVAMPKAPPGKKFNLLNLADPQLFQIIEVIKAHSKYPEHIATLRASCGEEDFELGMDATGLVMEIEAFQAHLLEAHSMTWFPENALQNFVGSATEGVGLAPATVLEDTAPLEAEKSVPAMDDAPLEAELANPLSTVPTDVPAVDGAALETEFASPPSTVPTDVPAAQPLDEVGDAQQQNAKDQKQKSTKETSGGPEQ